LGDVVCDPLLSAVLSSAKELKGGPVSRIVLAGRTINRELNVDFYKGQFGRLLDKHTRPDARFTGLLLVYPMCIVHLLEGPTATLTSIVHDLSSPNWNDFRLQEARVISSMECLPRRSCGSWCAAFIPSSSSMESAESAEGPQLAKLASSCCTSLRHVGEALTVMPEAEIRKQLQSIASFYEDVPTPEAILCLAASEQLPSVQNFSSIFSEQGPLVVLDAERTWPLSRLTAAVLM